MEYNLTEYTKDFADAIDITQVYANRYSAYSLCRYKKREILFDTFLHYGTMHREDMSITATDDQVTDYVVPQFMENRLDLIAYKFYGNSELYWVIAYFNNIIDPMVLAVGTELKIPSLSTLYVSGGILA